MSVGASCDPTSFGWVLLNGASDGDHTKPGGTVLLAEAAAALNVGDVVFYTSANRVNKSTTPANYALFAGVVVGGQLTAFQVLDDPLDIGTAVASAAGHKVYIQTSGIARVVADAAVAAGAAIQGGTVTAGRVDDPAAVAMQVIGTSLTAASNAGDAFLMLVDHR